MIDFGCLIGGSTDWLSIVRSREGKGRWEVRYPGYGYVLRYRNELVDKMWDGFLSGTHLHTTKITRGPASCVSFFLAF